MVRRILPRNRAAVHASSVAEGEALVMAQVRVLPSRYVNETLMCNDRQRNPEMALLVPRCSAGRETRRKRLDYRWSGPALDLHRSAV